MRRSILYFASARFVIAVPLVKEPLDIEERALLCAYSAPTDLKPSKAFKPRVRQTASAPSLSRARIAAILLGEGGGAVNSLPGALKAGCRYHERNTASKQARHAYSA
jgi:hypothetical protein